MEVGDYVQWAEWDGYNGSEPKGTIEELDENTSVARVIGNDGRPRMIEVRFLSKVDE